MLPPFTGKRTTWSSVVSYERYDDLRARDGCVIGVFSRFGATRHVDEALKVVGALNEESPG